MQFDGVVRKSFEGVKEEINRVEREERDRKIDHVLNAAKVNSVVSKVARTVVVQHLHCSFR